MLIDHTLPRFAEQTAAKTATPGGGSVAAYLAALGAALGAMAARFTEGRKGFEAHTARLASEIGRLDALRVECLQLVDADARSYDLVTAAYGLPKESEAEKSARRDAIQKALAEAMQTPLRTCRLAVQGLEVLVTLADHVNPNLASDVAVGAYALGAGYRGAWVNVLINLNQLKDEVTRQRVLAEGEDLGGRAAELEATVVAAIVDPLRG